jgi:hypothetical protein
VPDPGAVDHTDGPSGGGGAAALRDAAGGGGNSDPHTVCMMRALEGLLCLGQFRKKQKEQGQRSSGVARQHIARTGSSSRVSRVYAILPSIPWFACEPRRMRQARGFPMPPNGQKRADLQQTEKRGTRGHRRPKHGQRVPTHCASWCTAVGVRACALCLPLRGCCTAPLFGELLTATTAHLLCTQASS